MATALKRIEVIGEGERLDVTESHYPAGERGPGPHIHRRHTDAFWVLDGELELGLGPQVEPLRLGAGGFVLVPPGVVHTFRNPGPAEARFLNFHAPSMGFAAYLRGELRGFDQHDPPADGGRPAGDALVVTPDAAGERTGVAEVADTPHLAVAETTLAPAETTATRGDVTDSFYVLEGALTVRCGRRPLAVVAGEYAYFPPGASREVAARGEAPARFLNVRAPGVARAGARGSPPSG